MTADPWRERLRAATTESDVIEAANKYLASLDPRQLAMLPLRCRPRVMHCAHDVSSYAFDLVGHYCDKMDPSAHLLQSLATFLTDASIRLSEIVSDTNARQATAPRHKLAP
ncbi:MAG TPA: hypothetical protein VLY46_14580 [Usitatibacter sp.]|nr:hypothetical protein [Usitatibacter sp.]